MLFYLTNKCCCFHQKNRLIKIIQQDKQIREINIKHMSKHLDFFDDAETCSP